MLDIKRIREDYESMKAGVERRTKGSFGIEKIPALDEKRRAVLAEVEAMKNKQNTVFAIGKLILNKTSRTHIGNLCLEYGGGGHEAAGTCQIENLQAEEALIEITKRITTDG